MHEFDCEKEKHPSKMIFHLHHLGIMLCYNHDSHWLKFEFNNHFS